jgi:hypothetical protein
VAWTFALPAMPFAQESWYSAFVASRRSGAFVNDRLMPELVPAPSVTNRE